MRDLRKVAHDFISNNLWVIPIKADKTPACKNWMVYQDKPMNNNEIERYFKNCYGMALLCGGPTRVELLDWDLKYDLTGDFYDRVRKEIPIELQKKMFVQTTKNNGFHWWYKVPKESIMPNQKLAGRETTYQENHQTYIELLKDPQKRNKAMHITLKDNVRVLGETRGGSIEKCGGYGLISPTPNYNVVYKPEGGIQEITKEEVEFLHTTLRSFNEVVGLDGFIPKKYSDTKWEVDPFEDYNERGDSLGLLLNYGWETTEHSSRHGNYSLRRPGVSFGRSALYDSDTKVFNCFSTSTRFDCNKSYTPASVFIELECDGDPKQAYIKLVNLGYGIKKQ